MLQRFLDSTDAAQVMELMRAAELTALQITDEVEWSEDATTWSVVLLVPPARLVFRRSSPDAQDDLTPNAVPTELAEHLMARLRGAELWRIVRRKLEARLS